MHGMGAADLGETRSLSIAKAGDHFFTAGVERAPSRAFQGTWNITADGRQPLSEMILTRDGP